MKTYKDIYILTTNQAEKLAALTWLSAKTDLPIYKDALLETVDNVYVTEYPCVLVDGDEEVSAAAKDSRAVENKIEVLFADINKTEKILAKENRPKLVYGKKYFNKIWEFVIPIQTYKDDEVVFAGLFGDKYRLYSNDPQPMEAAVKFLKEGGWVLEE